MQLFDKILIANRGEIAVRIIKSAKKLGIKTVAVYSKADENSLHVILADEAYCIGEIDLQDSYLNIGKIINTAKNAKVQAIHPGYGFLSENADFANACKDANITFIGPDAETIAQMGNKIEARAYVKSIGIPLTEGVTGTHDFLIEEAGKMEFPILVKAAAGGGGKGMRIVRSKEELNTAIESTSREAKAYFGDESIYVEKYIENPRHIEIQIIGDNYGNVVHLYERECTIQRRYQKIIEESPSITLTPKLREEMGNAAVSIGKNIGYKNAGTIEFLVDNKLNFYFLEVNTRVQVEHPVTEMVTGIDIVEEQIIIAAGNELRFSQKDIKQSGHAIECRIYAEDPANNFLPSPGKMDLYLEPNGRTTRVDSGIRKASVVESFFDPMISKLIVHGANRDIARKRSVEALKNYIIHGIATNNTYLIHLLENKDFVDNNISTHFCDTMTESLLETIQSDKDSIPKHIPAISFLVFDMTINKLNKNANIWNDVGFWREIMEVPVVVDEKEYLLKLNINNSRSFDISIADDDFHVELKAVKDNIIELVINDYHCHSYISSITPGQATLSINGHIFKISRKDILDLNKEYISDDAAGSDKIASPMPGKVIKINCDEGDFLVKGDVVIVVESMKMENNIIAPFDLLINKINVNINDMIDGSTKLIDFEATNNE